MTTGLEQIIFAPITQEERDSVTLRTFLVRGRFDDVVNAFISELLTRIEVDDPEAMEEEIKSIVYYERTQHLFHQALSANDRRRAHDVVRAANWSSGAAMSELSNWYKGE